MAALIGLREYQKNTAYRHALQQEEKGDTVSAYAILESLGGYADAAARARSLLEHDPALALGNATKDDIVTFGSYEQDGDLGNGTEPLRWIVLDKIDGRLLLLALDSIAARPYNPLPFHEISWEKSELRAWMNTEFLHDAFSDEQRTLVIPTNTADITDAETKDEAGIQEDPHRTGKPKQKEERTLEEKPQQEKEAYQEENEGEHAEKTQKDLVFALSRTEADIYLGDDVERELIGAALISEAAKNPALPLDENGRADWWLRSRGNYGFTAQFVERNGSAYTPGANVDAIYAVRPAVWIDPHKGGGNR